MRRLGAFFWGFNFLNYVIFFVIFFLGGGGGSEILIFLGVENFVDIFRGSRQNWTSFRCLFYVF